MEGWKVNLKEVLSANGIGNCTVSIPMQPIRRNIYKYMRIKDKYIRVPCKFSEERYRLENNYKLTVVPFNEEFNKEHMYIADIETLIREGQAFLYVKNKRFHFMESL